MRAPLVSRALIRIASWIAPARVRSEWHQRWSVELTEWWLLIGRGEPLRSAGCDLCRRAFADALANRFRGIEIRQLARGPMFLLAAIAAAALLLAAFSHGFAVTRSVIALARDFRNHPLAPGAYDYRADRVFVYVAPILLTLTTASTILVMGCLSLRARGWRYWSFLACKIAAVFVLLPLFWIEGGTALRAHMAPGGWRITTALFLALVFLVVVSRGVIWSLADQRRRCPACLRRLVLPVTVGSWASQFEPATTEMLCEDGHGALALADRETNGEDRWTELDDSWRALFH